MFAGRFSSRPVPHDGNPRKPLQGLAFDMFFVTSHFP
jgi:hypothetical protein